VLFVWTKCSAEQYTKSRLKVCIYVCRYRRSNGNARKHGNAVVEEEKKKRTKKRRRRRRRMEGRRNE